MRILYGGIEMNNSRVWIYCRTMQDDSTGPDAIQNQKNRLEQYAKQHGMEIAGVSSDFQSGLSLDRPGLREVDKAVQDRLADIVLVVSMDRLCQKVEDLVGYWYYLQRYGVRFYTARRGEIKLRIGSVFLKASDII